jgi:hypothetical protein
MRLSTFAALAVIGLSLSPVADGAIIHETATLGPTGQTWLLTAISTAFLAVCMRRSCKVPRIIVATLALLVLSATSTVQAQLLTGATLTNIIDVGAARPGIAVGGVFYDPAMSRLILVGDNDFDTPNANLFRFTTGGAFVSETYVPVPGGGINAISGYPGSSDFTISSATGLTGATISRITRGGTIVSSRTLSGVQRVGGLALNPTTGHLWAVESIGDTDTLRELDADFNVLQTISYASLFPGENMIGLEIDPFTGNFIGVLHGDFLSSRRIVEFDPGVTTILSVLTDVDHPGWDSLTSISIGGPPMARKLYFSSGGSMDPMDGPSDVVFEFQLPIPEPTTWMLPAIAASLLAVWRRLLR